MRRNRWSSRAWEKFRHRPTSHGCQVSHVLKHLSLLSSNWKQVEKSNFVVNFRVCITDINEEVGLAAVKELTEVEGFDQVSMQVKRSKA